MAEISVEERRADALSTHRNKFGYRGVSEDRPGRFRASLGSAKSGNLWRSKYYWSSFEAAVAYDKEARRRYGDHAYLNFPSPYEYKVQEASEGVCKNGHERSKHTYVAPNGKHHCRKCNLQSQHRRQLRKRIEKWCKTRSWP